MDTLCFEFNVPDTKIKISDFLLVLAWHAFTQIFIFKFSESFYFRCFWHRAYNLFFSFENQVGVFLFWFWNIMHICFFIIDVFSLNSINILYAILCFITSLFIIWSQFNCMFFSCYLESSCPSCHNCFSDNLYNNSFIVNYNLLTSFYLCLLRLMKKWV